MSSIIYLFFLLLSRMNSLSIKSSNTWTYGMSNASRLRAPIARLPDPTSSMRSPHRPVRMNTSSILIIQLKPTDKKSSIGQSGELCPNWPKFTTPHPKINVDSKTHFRYLDGLFLTIQDSTLSLRKRKRRELH